MPWSKLLEFFQDTDGGLSMTRLLMFLAFGPASYALIHINTSDALLWYLSAFVLGYVGGKGAEILRRAPPPAQDAAPKELL